MPICSPCSEGGAWNKAGRYETAKEFHDNCLYPGSCTCQHRVGEGNVREEGDQN